MDLPCETPLMGLVSRLPKSNAPAGRSQAGAKVAFRATGGDTERTLKLVTGGGIEPPTLGLRARRSTSELSRKKKANRRCAQHRS